MPNTILAQIPVDKKVTSNCIGIDCQWLVGIFAGPFSVLILAAWASLGYQPSVYSRRLAWKPTIIERSPGHDSRPAWGFGPSTPAAGHLQPLGCRHTLGHAFAHGCGTIRTRPRQATGPRTGIPLRPHALQSHALNLLRQLDADAVEAALGRWVLARCPDLGEQICLDGKTARGSRDGSIPAVHLLAAYALTWPP